MSQVISASEEPVTFFTCTTPGVFCLSFDSSGTDDWGYVYRNDVSVATLANDLDSFIIKLNTDDQLKYKGPGAIVSGFRNGDEF